MTHQSKHQCSRMQRLCSRTVFVFLVGVILASCTTTTIAPLNVTPPSQDFDKVIVGEISVSDPVWDAQLPYFRRALVSKLRGEQKFTMVFDAAPVPPPEDAILISGQITEIDKGNKALRALIGFGAGRARAAGMFSISDARGAELVQFESRKAYSGGAGIGGFDLLDIEDLMEELGEETADSIIRWAKGESMEPPKKN